MIKKSVVQKVAKEEGKLHKMRFSNESVEKLTGIINEIGGEIVAHSKMLAEHAKRSTVNESDIKLVLK